MCNLNNVRVLTRNSEIMTTSFGISYCGNRFTILQLNRFVYQLSIIVPKSGMKNKIMKFYKFFFTKKKASGI